MLHLTIEIGLTAGVKQPRQPFPTKREAGNVMNNFDINNQKDNIAAKYVEPSVHPPP